MTLIKKNIKSLWNSRTITNLVAGIFFFACSIVVLYTGESKGLIYRAIGIEAYLRSIGMILFSLILILSPFFGILNIKRTMLYIPFIVGTYMSIELISRLLVNILGIG